LDVVEILYPEVNLSSLHKSEIFRFRFGAYQGRAVHELGSSKPVQRCKNSQCSRRYVQKTKTDVMSNPAIDKASPKEAYTIIDKASPKEAHTRYSLSKESV
jgi:hypothetical protein